MNRYTLLLLLLMAMAAPPAGAQSKVDSLTARLATAVGHERVQLLVELMRAEQADAPRSLDRGREALSILDRAPAPALRADVLYFISAAFYNLNEPDSAMAYAVASRDLATQLEGVRQRERSGASEVRTRLGQAERFIGHIESYRGQYQEAEEAYLRAGDVFELMRDRQRVADVTNDIAILSKNRGDYPRALELHGKALAAYQGLGNERDAANALHGLGIVYSHMGRYDDALESFFASLAIHEEMGDQIASAGTMVNIGGTYQYLENYPQALRYYSRARDVYEGNARTRSLATVLTNIGSLHELLEEHDEAHAAFTRARELATETRNHRLLAYINNATGRLFERQGDRRRAEADFKAALAAFEQIGDRRGIVGALLALGRLSGGREGIARTLEALDLASGMDSHLLRKDVYGQLSDLYAAEGLFSEALDAYRAYKAAHDSLFNSESQSTIARLDTEYRTREREQQIAILEHKRQVQRLWLTGLVGGIGLFGVIAALSLNRARLRKRALIAQDCVHRAEAERTRLAAEAAEARASLLEVENARRAHELENARRLQLSMLPRDLPEHPHVQMAAFMRTATEVGGDYYDYAVCPEGELTIAIGDATGHGSAAGTLVAAAKSLFSTYSDEPELSEALRRSARALRRMALPNLYMAFALARLAPGRLELAGAGMPAALHHRAASGDVAALSLKGMPLGAPIDYPYRMQQVAVSPGDTILLMSDGLPELRNGAAEELGAERVAELLRHHGSSDPEIIKHEIIRQIEAWTADQAIADDITFLVLRIR